MTISLILGVNYMYTLRIYDIVITQKNLRWVELYFDKLKKIKELIEKNKWRILKQKI